MLKRSAKAVQGPAGLRAVASIAANDAALGDMVAEAFERAGNHGIVAVEFGNTVRRRWKSSKAWPSSAAISRITW